MAFLSYSEIEKFAEIVDKIEIIKFASILDEKKTVFLSHSSSDNEYLFGIINFLKKFKAEAYIDDGDQRLPLKPSPETAQILRNQIKQCPRFIVLISPNSKNSKWIPWELGLADSFKGVAKEALLPIAPTSQEEEWMKQEYLGLYPRIVYGKLEGHSEEIWKVFDPRDKTSWTLEYWLNDSHVI